MVFTTESVISKQGNTQSAPVKKADRLGSRLGLDTGINNNYNLNSTLSISEYIPLGSTEYILNT